MNDHLFELLLLNDAHRRAEPGVAGMSKGAKLYMPCRRWLMVVSSEGQVILETAGEHVARAVPVAGSPPEYARH